MSHLLFRLNEGFTVFLERKIIGRLEGELERQFESECGYDVGFLAIALVIFYVKAIPGMLNVGGEDFWRSSRVHQVDPKAEWH